MQEKPPIIISMGNDKYKYKDTIQIVKCDNIKIKQLNCYYCVHVEIQDWWTSINGIKKHTVAHCYLLYQIKTTFNQMSGISYISGGER